MAQFVQVPTARLDTDVLLAMLEDFASRDGTDYGIRELSLEEKVSNLRLQLSSGDLVIVYDLDSEQWDLCTKQRLPELSL
ncbi:MAG: YheU family protein [Halieaceae bacterium]